MAEAPKIQRVNELGADYRDALVGSGLVDDIVDLERLEPRPYRYAEGEVISRHGDPAESLWVIVNGSIAVKEGESTLFIRRRNEVVGEQHLVGNGYRRIYDLVAIESSVEVLVIEKTSIEGHPEAGTLWRNIARIISVKLRNTSKKASSLSRQLADDTRILHAYTNEYALGRRLRAGSLHQAEYQVDKAIIWFSDVVDFNRHTLKMSPDRIADIVQRFFNAQSLPIISGGGHIDKFMGDGMMAFWVLPQTTTGAGETCIEAIRAAEEAVRAVREISIGNESLLLRIGLHLGMVVSGDFGSATRHQFTLIGREVNKAARLEQVRPEDVVEGVSEIGPIRLSHEFRDELSTVLQRRYNRKTVVGLKGNGRLELFSE